MGALAPGMRLDEFARAGLALRVWSEVLGERVVFASDNAHVAESHGGPVVYRARELRELLGLTPEDLRRVHEVKRIFGGEVCGTDLNFP